MHKILQIDKGYFSIQECVQCIQKIFEQYSVFRTRLTFDEESGKLYQWIDSSKRLPVRISSVLNREEMKSILREEMWTRLDTENDGVFRCHIVQMNSCSSADFLSINDLIIFSFHHGSFDGQAMDLFLDQLKLVCHGGNPSEQALQYIDYSIHERSSPMTDAEQFWREFLKDYGWEKTLFLGNTKKYASDCRSGFGEIRTFPIPIDIAQRMISIANKLNITLFQLGLTCFYLYLNQLSIENRDACIGVIHQNRYRPEIVPMIGMFVNVLPCRIFEKHLEQLTFIELIHKVQKVFLQTVENAQFPYDELINLHRIPWHSLKLPYLQMIFSVDTTLIDYSNIDNIALTDTCFASTYKINPEDIEVGFKFDLDVSFTHDKVAGTIDCVWAYMFDVFSRETVDQHANDFNELLARLFSENENESLEIPLQQLIILSKNCPSQVYIS